MSVKGYVGKSVLASLGVGFATEGLELAKAGEPVLAAAFGAIAAAFFAIFAWLLEKQVVSNVLKRYRESS